MDKNDKQLIKEVAYFLRYGGLKENLCQSRKDCLKKFPFLNPIVRLNHPDPNALAQNANWFWLSPNDINRDTLANDIERIREIDFTDEYYGKISIRLTSGDGYGIQPKTLKAQEEPYNAETYKEAFEWYVQNEKIDSVKSYFFEDSHYKVVYCRKRKLPFSVVTGWLRCELILSESLNYAEYKAVNDLIYGDPDELKVIYMSDEYKELKQNMYNALVSHRKDVGSQALILVNSIKNVLENQPSFSPQEFIKAKNDYLKFVELYEAPEGASDEKKRKLEILRYSFVKQLSDNTKALLGIDRVGNIKGGAV